MDILIIFSVMLFFFIIYVLFALSTFKSDWENATDFFKDESVMLSWSEVEEIYKLDPSKLKVENKGTYKPIYVLFYENIPVRLSLKDTHTLYNKYFSSERYGSKNRENQKYIYERIKKDLNEKSSDE